MRLLMLMLTVWAATALAEEAPATTPTPSVAPATANGMRSLRRFFSEVRTYSADFEQVVLDDSKEVLQESQGRLWIERPNKFRWNYETPYKQQIVSDGARLWIYDQDLEQVTVRPIERGLQDTPALLLAGRGSLDEQFQIKDLGTDNKLDWVQLKPRNKESGFDEIRIGFEQGKLRVFELSDAFGQLTRYRMRGGSENIAIDPSRFSFTPPSGADVLTQP